MEKIIYYNELYLIYKDVLDENKSDIFNLYYGDNLTMQEIADLNNISKARVGIIIKDIEKELDNLEDNLSLYKKKESLKKLLNENDINKIKNEIESIIKGE